MGLDPKKLDQRPRTKSAEGLAAQKRNRRRYMLKVLRDRKAMGTATPEELRTLNALESMIQELGLDE
ncbi:MAG: hypothetical protein ACE5IO_06495 [Thermoplasmata archaeon]